MQREHGIARLELREFPSKSIWQIPTSLGSIIPYTVYPKQPGFLFIAQLDTSYGIFQQIWFQQCVCLEQFLLLNLDLSV